MPLTHIALQNPEPSTNPPSPTIGREESWSTRNGFRTAASLEGIAASLEPCLIGVYRGYQGEADPRRHEYESRIKVLGERSAVLESELAGLRSHQAEDSPQIRDMNKNIKELEDAAARPSPSDANDHDPMTFFVGAGLFACLSIYLFVFYTSAGYSAFFKNVGDAIASGSQADRIQALFSSIFDASAISEAARTGNLFVLSFPAIFLSLGFVIHKLYEHGQRATAAVFLLVALAFDCLIAYQIAAKLFQASVLTGFASGEFTIRNATADSNFWSVIAAGFVVYIVWTFVLGFMMHEMRNRANRRRTLHGLWRRIEETKGEVHRLEAQREDSIKQKTDEINGNRVEIERLQAQVEGHIIRWPVVEERIETFVRGWLDYIIGVTASPAEQIAKVEEVRMIVNAYKASVQRSFSVGGSVVTLKDARL